MKRIFFLAATAVLASCQMFTTLYQVGDGESVDTLVDVQEFETISVPSSLDVFYTQEAGDPSVVLTCDSNLVEYFNIRVENGTLVVDTQKGYSLSPKVKTYLRVKSAKLTGVKSSGSGDIEISSSLTNVEDFSVKASGSGDIFCLGTILCTNFSSSVTGSGDTSLAGVQATTADFKDSGSGDIGVDYLNANDINVRMTGSGDVSLTCVNAGYIVANLSGSGDLILTGGARSVQSDVTGSGRVNSKDLTIIKQ